jgi:hypothetical protein
LAGELFGELRSKARFRPSFRLSVQAAFTPDAGERTRILIGTGQLEACPLALGSGRLQLRPCTALALGAVRATSSSQSGTSDAGLWAAWATHARLSWDAARAIGLDIQVGLIIPLTQYELTVEEPSRTVAKTRFAGLALGLGAHWPLP